MNSLLFVIFNIGVVLCSIHSALPFFESVKDRLRGAHGQRNEYYQPMQREINGQYPYNGMYSPPPMNDYNAFAPTLPFYPNNPSASGYGSASASPYDSAYGSQGFPGGMYPQPTFGSTDPYTRQGSYPQPPFPPTRFPSTYGSYPSFPNQGQDPYQINPFRPKPQHHFPL